MDTSDFRPTKSKAVSVELIKKLKEQDRRGVILTSGEWVEFTDEKTGEITKKPKIDVSIGGVSHEWILNQTTNERLGEEIGTYDTTNWIGCVIKFLVDERGTWEYVTATLIDKPNNEETIEEKEAGNE